MAGQARGPDERSNRAGQCKSPSDWATASGTGKLQPFRVLPVAGLVSPRSGVEALWRLSRPYPTRGDRRTQLKPPFHLLNPRKRLVAVRLCAPPYAERPDYLPRFPTHQRRMVDVAM